MYSTLKYETIKRDYATPARLSRMENPVMNKVIGFPSAMIHMTGKEDIDFLKWYFNKELARKNFSGIVVPYDRLMTFGPQIRAYIPKNFLFLADIQSEVFFRGNLKEGIWEVIKNSKTVPEEVKALVEELHSTRGSGDKVELHRQLWNLVLTNKNIMYSLIRYYVNTQMAQGLDGIGNIAPTIIDIEDLDVVETLYKEALGLYHGSLLDIEKEQGRFIYLHLAIAKKFLDDKNNIRELFKMIERCVPKMVTFKLIGMDDIREHPTLADNYKLLLKGLGAMSDEMGFPSVYLCGSTAGLIAHAWGIDSFSQMLRPNLTLETEFRASSATMKRLWKQNPELTAGSIYVYDEKDFFAKPKFESMVKTNGGHVPSPIDFLNTVDLEHIKSMSGKSFRQYAKSTIMATRNFEEEEIRNAILTGDIISLKNRFKRWLKDLAVFP